MNPSAPYPLPFKVERIDHVVLRVTDIERSILFYKRLLGCVVVKRRPDLGLAHLRAGSSMIDLVSVDGRLGRKGGAAPATTGRNMEHLCLRIEPFVESDIKALLAAHDMPPSASAQVNFGAEGDGLSIYLTDPDGNAIELKGPSVDI